tara:strand:+ start:52811 stop:53737 length:927 start_codon:yes stop_codon:yes gene_type:complete
LFFKGWRFAGGYLKKFFVLIFLFQSVSSLAQVAANTDLPEVKLRMIYMNRDSFIKPCAANPSPCGLTPAELKQATDLLAASPMFQGLEFTSSSWMPQLPTTPGTGRQTPLYTSEKMMGAKIMVNSARLLNAPFKPVAPFELYVESMLGYMFFQPSQKLAPTAALAKKFSLFWGQLFKSYGLDQLKEDRIELLVFKNKEVRVMLLDSYQAHFLNPYILKNLKCDAGSAANLLTSYSNLGWTQYKPSTTGSKASGRMQVTYECASSSARQAMAAELTFETEFLGADKKQWNNANFLVKVGASRRGGAVRR